MQKPHTPINEIERLAALKSFNILDTLPEEIFDHYTVLASQICGTPIALISLLDETRQWFKSKVGLDVTETPREISFCGHAILQDDLFEIKDALADERFTHNPLITGEPKLRFYTGMPITTPEGYNLGTICVIDTQPRLLSDPQRDALKRIAKLIMSQIEQRQAKNTILQLNQTLYQNANFVQKLIDNVPATIGYWDKNLECVFANAVYQTVFGVDAKAMRGTHYLDIFPEHMTEKTYPYIQKALLGEKQMVQVSRLMDGFPEHRVVYYTPHFDENNHVLGIFALGLDLTNIKETERKLKLTEKALESTREAIFITNANHEIFYVNSGFSILTGFSAEEAIGKQQSLLKSNEQHEDFFLSLNQAIEKFGFWQGVIVNRHKEGALYSALMTIDSIKNDAGMLTNYVASMIDITESEKTKNDLATFSAMLKRTGKMANVGGWEYDFHTEKILWSDQMYSIHEIDDYKIPDIDSAIMFYQVEARETIKNAIESCIKDGTAWDLELPFTTAKGRSIWVRTIGEMININGINIKLAGTCQDITERKIQEQQTITREINLRNSLVREVHHHIKNNIQGISGILFNAADNNPLLAEPINKAISKLNSIAVIHGLQGKNVDTQIELGELVQAISHNIEVIWQSQIKLFKPEQWLECYLAKNEAVPIALILNELTTNAQKHGTKDCMINITVTQITNNSHPNEVRISIANSGEFKRALREESDINQKGLKLVTSLMPKTGAYLSFLFEDNESQVTLALKYPIITFKPITALQ